MALGVTLSHSVCVRRAAYITYQLHASLALAVKVMCCIKCSLVYTVAAAATAAAAAAAANLSLFNRSTFYKLLSC